MLWFEKKFVLFCAFSLLVFQIPIPQNSAQKDTCFTPLEQTPEETLAVTSSFDPLCIVTRDSEGRITIETDPREKFMLPGAPGSLQRRAAFMYLKKTIQQSMSLGLSVPFMKELIEENLSDIDFLHFRWRNMISRGDDVLLPFFDQEKEQARLYRFSPVDASSATSTQKRSEVEVSLLPARKISLGEHVHGRIPEKSERFEIGKGIDLIESEILEDNKSPSAIFRLLYDKDLITTELFQKLEHLSDARIKDELSLIARDLVKESKMSGIPLNNEKLLEKGFRPGWGKDGNIITERLQNLPDLISGEDLSLLEKLPLIRSVIIPSVHGWFSSNALGLPSTGGQVIYVLQQAEALGEELKERLTEAGIEEDPQVIILSRLIPENVFRGRKTSCNIPLEPVNPAKYDFVNILRVPFYDTVTEQVMPSDIDRFKVWPYIDRYADDSFKEINDYLARKGLGFPDAIMGNYSDGNLVAALLSQKYFEKGHSVLQQAMPHTLEAPTFFPEGLPKDPAAWTKKEEEFWLSLMTFSDLIGLLSAHLRTGNTVLDGLREHGLLHDFSLLFAGLDFEGGIYPDGAEFNANAPGTCFDTFYPFYERKRREKDKEAEDAFTSKLNDLEHGDGYFDKEKPLLFTLSRLERKKNIPALLKAYAENEDLQEHFNLLLVLGGNDLLADVADEDEKREALKILQFFDPYNPLFDRLNDPEYGEYFLEEETREQYSKLKGKMRRIQIKKDPGILFRMVAETGGVFVQPALHESFGLTVLEAALSGLPVVATKRWGPSFILDHGVNGYLFDPKNTQEMADAIRQLIPEKHWKIISDQGIQNVRNNYSWPIHVNKALKNMSYTMVFQRLRKSAFERRRELAEDLYGQWTEYLDNFMASHSRHPAKEFLDTVISQAFLVADSASPTQQKIALGIAVDDIYELISNTGSESTVQEFVRTMSDKINNVLSVRGLNNTVKIIPARNEDLGEELELWAKKNNVSPSNMIALFSEPAFAEPGTRLHALNEAGLFLAEMDLSTLKKAKRDPGVPFEKEIYLPLLEMKSLALRLALDRLVSSEAIDVERKGPRHVIFLPKAELFNLEALSRKYRFQMDYIDQSA